MDKGLKSLFVLSILLTLGCKKVATSDAELSSDILNVIELAVGSKVSLYHSDSNNVETFLGDAAVQNNKMEIPSGILSGIYGDRIEGNTASDIGLSVRIYNPTGTSGSGDFFFESPVYGKYPIINSATTALYYFLKNNVVLSENHNPVISRSTWRQMILTLDFSCKGCSVKNTSEVVNILQTNSRLQGEILSLLQTENPTASLSVKNSQLWNWVVVKSTHKILNFRSSILGVDEGVNENINLEMYHPAKSTQRFEPKIWEHFVGASLENTQFGAVYNSTFSFSSEGTNQIRATIEDPKNILPSKVVDYIYSVGNVNLMPVIVDIPTLNFQVNHELTYDLVTYLSDPDGDTNLTLSVVEGPIGLIISGNKLIWNPLSSQLGALTAKVAVTDSENLQSITKTINLLTIADSPPVITAFTAFNTFTENIEGFTISSATDADGDKLLIDVDVQSQFVSGSPTGAGWLSTVTEVTGPDGNQSFKFYFKPSFLQTVAVNNVNYTVTLQLHYDPSVATLRDVTPVTQTITFQVINVDDPPIWTGTLANQNITENVAYSFALGGGLVADSTYSPTVLSYSLSGVTGNCVMTINSGTGEVSGTTGYLTPASCDFNVVATDASGLSTASSTVSYSTTNDNRLPTIKLALPNATVNENEELEIELKTYFEDLDDVEDDPREQLEFVCSNCSALGITDYTLNSSGFFRWTPDYTKQGVFSNVQIELKDKHMVDNVIAAITQSFDITVNGAAAPTILTAGANSFEVNEGATSSTSLSIDGFSGNAVDIYNYDVTFTCSTCSNNLVSIRAGSETGNSSATKEVFLDFTPDFADGNNTVLPYNVHIFRVKATKTGDPTVFAEKSFTVQVNNINRVPTGFKVNFEGVEDSEVTPYELIIDLSKASNRFKNFVLNLSLLDLDGASDTYSFSFDDIEANPPIGTISGDQWSFTPIGCATNKTETIQRNFFIKGADASGAFIVREIHLILTKTKASAICPQI